MNPERALQTKYVRESRRHFSKRLFGRVQGLLRYTFLRVRLLNRLPQGSFILVKGHLDLDIQKNASLTRGKDCIFASHLTLRVDGEFTLGNQVYIGPQGVITCFNSITIGDGVRIGERVSIHDENHVYEPLPLTFDHHQMYRTSSIKIEDRVWIGANVTVLPGTNIGQDTVVAAGSIVRGNLEPRSLYAGNPAKLIRRLADVTSQ